MKKTLTYGIIALCIIIIAFCIFRYGNFRRKTVNPLPAPVAVVPATSPAIETPALHYIEIADACNWSFIGTCVNVRSGPGTDYPIVMRLRDGMVFEVEATTISGTGHDWYKVIFEPDLKYPERVTSGWYIAAVPGVVLPFIDSGEQNLTDLKKSPTGKEIIVSLSKQTLSAYDGTVLFMQEPVSTGIKGDETNIGRFEIFKKIPSRYMQGPLPGVSVSDGYYDLPGTPWDMYFSADGSVLHGAYWHNNFGKPMSHGCVNQSPENAKKLYYWAPLGTPVIVQE